MSRAIKGNSLSVGNGISCFMRINKEYISTDEKVPAEYRNNGITIDLGTLSDVMYKTERDISPSYVSGNRNPIDFNKGKRLTTGRLVFSVFDQDTLQFVMKEISTGTNTTDKGLAAYLEKGSFFSIGKTSADLAGNGTTDDNAQTVEGEIKYLDQLPPVDIIITGMADDVKKLTIDGETAPKMYRNCQYKLELNGVKLLNDNFAVVAGQALQDQVINIMIVGGIKPWQKVV